MEAIFTNACTLRMCYTLNQVGVKVPYMAGETVSDKNGDWNFFRLGSFESDYWTPENGPPDMVVDANYGHGSLNRADFIGHQGVIIFRSQMGDATGHLDLWDGYGHCRWKCYWDRADSVELWEVP